jgi:hypothetical protein
MAAVAVNAKARHKQTTRVFFIGITSFLNGFSVLSVWFLTSEEEIHHSL